MVFNPLGIRGISGNTCRERGFVESAPFSHVKSSPDPMRLNIGVWLAYTSKSHSSIVMVSMVLLDHWTAKKLVAGLLAAMAVGALLNCRLDAPRQGWSRRWGPLVPHKTFPADCGICHVTQGWNVLRKDFSFDHEKETGYPLKGAHAGAACLRCHNDRGPVQSYIARGCGGCHPDPHTSSLGLDCQRCHEQISWRPTGLIAEHARTRFPLFGAHAVAPCENCHPGAPAGQFRGAPVQCDLCHRAELARATSPDHAASGWITDCQRCHTPLGWERAFVRHDFFPLSGGHAGLDCTRCHTSGVLGKIPSDCYSCHAASYQTAPGHAAQSFPHTCGQCHSITAWLPARYDHTSFPLTGAHAGLDCTRCHTGGTFGPLPSNCNSCHVADYQGAPNHSGLGFPQTCQQCHTTAAWIPSTFRHTFPLSGSHNRSCTECHTTGSTSTFSCVTCHTASSTNGDHREVAGYSYSSQACYQCHPTGRN